MVGSSLSRLSICVILTLDFPRFLAIWVFVRWGLFSFISWILRALSIGFSLIFLSFANSSVLSKYRLSFWIRLWHIYTNVCMQFVIWPCPGSYLIEKGTVFWCPFQLNSFCDVKNLSKTGSPVLRSSNARAFERSRRVAISTKRKNHSWFFLKIGRWPLFLVFML